MNMQREFEENDSEVQNFLDMIPPKLGEKAANCQTSKATGKPRLEKVFTSPFKAEGESTKKSKKAKTSKRMNRADLVLTQQHGAKLAKQAV